MISGIHAHCSVKGCKNHVAMRIAEDMKKKGEPIICYEHNSEKPENIKNLYGGKYGN